MDVTHVPCGADGWGHLTAVIDRHDREIVAYELALRGRPKKTEGALEEVYTRRFGTIRPQGETPDVRSDNGLIFQSRRLRRARQNDRPPHEFTTPHTPEQNGTIGRFLRNFEEERTWRHNFERSRRTRRSSESWSRWYNEERPHRMLIYRSPIEIRLENSTKWPDIRGSVHLVFS